MMIEGVAEGSDGDASPRQRLYRIHIGRIHGTLIVSESSASTDV